MSSDVWLPAILGFIAGVLGSLVAPWVHWAIEKHRSKLQYRVGLVQEWRETMDGCLRDGRDFMETRAYLSLRPHVSPDVLKKVEDGRGLYATGSAVRPGDARHQWLCDEIDRVEREWDLV